MSNIKNAKIKIPLIERIIVCGVSLKEIQTVSELSTTNEELIIDSLSNLNAQILEEYNSSFLKEEDCSFIVNIPKYSIPFGLSPKILKTKNYEGDKKIISFSLVNSTKLKHCSSLSFYENYFYNDKYILMKKSITLVSSKDYYGTQKEILDNIYKIISNFYIYKNKNPNFIRKIYIENSFSNNINYFSEYQLLSFYFSFLLNSFDINPNNNKLIKSFFVIPLSSIPYKNCINDSFQLYKNILCYDDFFMKIYLDDKTPFPIKDYNLSILLDKFHVDDLIILYQSLLMEYEIILIFNIYLSNKIWIFIFINIKV